MNRVNAFNIDEYAKEVKTSASRYLIDGFLRVHQSILQGHEQLRPPDLIQAPSRNLLAVLVVAL